MEQYTEHPHTTSINKSLSRHEEKDSTYQKNEIKKEDRK